MDNDTLNLQITKRHELISELITLTKDKFYNIIVHIYQKAKETNKAKEYIIRDFQIQLREVASWDIERIKDIGNNFKERANALPQILQNIHTLNQRLFPSEVCVIEMDKSLDLLENFIKIACLNIAREIWKKAYFVYEVVDRKNYSQYQESIEKLIVTSIKTTIRRQSNIDAICASLEESKDESVVSDEEKSDLYECVAEEIVVKDPDTASDISTDTQAELDAFLQQTHANTHIHTRAPSITSVSSHTSVGETKKEIVHNDDSASDITSVHNVQDDEATSSRSMSSASSVSSSASSGLSHASSVKEKKQPIPIKPKDKVAFYKEMKRKYYNKYYDLELAKSLMDKNKLSKIEKTGGSMSFF